MSIFGRLRRSTVRGLYRVGIRSFDAGDYHGAVESFERVMARAGCSSPFGHLACFYRGESIGLLAEETYRRGDRTAAAAGLAAAAAAGAVTCDRLLLWARSASLAGRWDGASELSATALVLVPEEPLALALLRLACMRQQQPEGGLADRLQLAEETLGMAAEVAPHRATAAVLERWIDRTIDRRLEDHLALAALTAGRLDEASRRYRALAASAPGDRRAQAALICIAVRQGADGEAWRLLRGVALAGGRHMATLRRQFLEIGCLGERTTAMLQVGLPSIFPAGDTSRAD